MIENGKINIYRIGEKIFVDKWKKGRKEQSQVVFSIVNKVESII